MKKIMILGFAMAIIIAGCKKKDDDGAVPNGCTIPANFAYVIDSVNHQVKFANASSPEAVLFTWTFGDNSAATAANPSHAYTSAGTFPVKLSVMSADGKCTGEITQFVSVPLSAITVPSVFTKKVMVEEMTGAWCGWCVLGAEGIKKAEDAHHGQVNAVALHGGGGEPMLVPEYSALLSFAGATGVPHYRLNRGTGGGFPGSFLSSVTSALAQPATCGIAIDAKASSGNNVTFTVHAGFNSTLTGDYRLIAYLVEDSLKNSNSSYDQENYVAGNSSYSTSYYYSQPSTITNYSHKHVARKLLSASLTGGDQIPASEVVAGHVYKKTYTYTVSGTSGWNNQRLSVVVGILKYNATCSSQQILNSQTVKLGTIKSWD